MTDWSTKSTWCKDSWSDSPQIYTLLWILVMKCLSISSHFTWFDQRPWK